VSGARLLIRYPVLRILTLALAILFIEKPSLAQEVPTPTRSVPPECASQISVDTAEPTMFPFDGPLLWGLSTRPARPGSPLRVLLWIANPTAEAHQVATCSDIDRFWLYGIDVIDDAGKVIPWRGGKKRSADDDLFCFRNFAIRIPPHTCHHTTFTEHESDFSRDLQTLYDLPQGKYFIVSRTKKNSESIPVTKILEAVPKLAVFVE